MDNMHKRSNDKSENVAGNKHHSKGLVASVSRLSVVMLPTGPSDCPQSFSTAEIVELMCDK